LYGYLTDNGISSILHVVDQRRILCLQQVEMSLQYTEYTVSNLVLLYREILSVTTTHSIKYLDVSVSRTVRGRHAVGTNR